MAGSLIVMGHRTSTNAYEYCVDNISDLELLPTRKNGVLIKGKTDECKGHIPSLGSVCLIMKTSQVFILTNDGWVELGCDCGCNSSTTTTTT